jgi:hypothetical protein
MGSEGMTLLAKVLREPLVHFLVIGAVIFAVYSFVQPADEAVPLRGRIVVSEGRVAQLTEVFTRTWQRAPTQEELRGLVEGFVQEEVYYREALKLGLDRDDTVVRRRLQQKMEFLIEPAEAVLQASDEELDAFLVAHREDFRIAPRIAFRQVFFSPEKREPPAVQRAAATLDELSRAGPGDAVRELGDPTLLPGEMPLTSALVIARSFGEDFAAQLGDLPEGAWHGPVASPFGLHVVLVTERIAGYDPPLAQVRAAVRAEWQHRRREDFAQQEYQRLLDGYEVTLPFDDSPDGAAQ